MNPTFSMALGNIAKCLQHYASLEGDAGHRAVLLKEAFKYYGRALKNVGQNTYPAAQEYFVKNYQEIIQIYGKDWLSSPIKYNEKSTQSEKESDYREWCLLNHLFLNTLNDLPDSNMAFAADPIHFSSIRVSIEHAGLPFVVEMFNQVKEEFIYARLLFYEAVEGERKLHFADKEVYLVDTLNYCSYSVRLEKLKTAYRTLYSLFDRIAFLLNAYLELGISEREINFDRIFEYRQSDKQNLINFEHDNIAIQALHWIERDFKEKFGDADTPHTRKLKLLRHAMEHKFVSMQLFSSGNEEVKIAEDNIYHVSEDQLVEYTMDLIKLVRETIIELVVAINIEERKQNVNDNKVASLTMAKYVDDFKR